MLKVFLLVVLIAFAYCAPAEQTDETEVKSAETEKNSEDTAPTDETLKTDASGWYGNDWGWPSYYPSHHSTVKYYYPTYSSGWSGDRGWNKGWNTGWNNGWNKGWNNGWGSY